MWQENLQDGSLQRVAFAVLVIGLSALAERGWQTLRWFPYFATGFPLTTAPLPLRRMPAADSGAVSGLRWEKVAGRQAARWWADPHARGFARGLHGIVWFGTEGRGVEIDVRWSPPWTPIMAFVWLGALGAVDGQVWLTVPLAAVLTFSLSASYHREAARAGACLRYGWARDEEEP